MTESQRNIDLIFKVFIFEDNYLLIRPWSENSCFYELCTDPGDNSEGWFGRVSIPFTEPEKMRTLAKALNLAADFMEKQ